MQIFQANTKKLFSIVFWRAGKATFSNLPFSRVHAKGLYFAKGLSTFQAASMKHSLLRTLLRTLSVLKTLTGALQDLSKKHLPHERVRETKDTVRVSVQEYLFTGSSKVSSCGFWQNRVRLSDLLEPTLQYSWFCLTLKNLLRTLLRSVRLHDPLRVHPALEFLHEGVAEELGAVHPRLAPRGHGANAGSGIRCKKGGAWMKLGACAPAAPQNQNSQHPLHQPKAW